MSCRTADAWRRALAHRFEADAVEPADWPELEAHLSSCAPCRRLAMAIDPTLVFERLPAVSSAVADPEAMRVAVMGMLRARALEASVEPPRSVWRARSWRWAAAAALALMVGSLAARAPQHPVTGAAMGAEARVRSNAAAGAVGPAALTPSGVGPFVDASVLPLVEDTDRPGARVYSLGNRDLAVVMIVDKSLDL